MRLRLLLCCLVVACLALPLQGQRFTQDPSIFLPRASIAGGYTYLRANAPPAACGCFTMNAGFLAASVPVRPWLSTAAQVTAGHSHDIGPLGQNLTLTTYTAGPQITFRYSRFVPFAQALAGAAHGADSWFPTPTSFRTSATSFAFTLGGGTEYHLNHRFALRLFDVQYLHTAFPNGSGSGQQHLLVSTGFVYKFGGGYAIPGEVR